jgi:ABC-2 type transport system ATP-binding protein
VSKSFGSTRALLGVDLTVEVGTVVGLLGPNGAGKTTLVRILTTLLKPDAGWATIAGLDAVRDATALRSVIGLAGQYAAVDETLTGRENLELVGELYHLGRRRSRQRTQEVLGYFGLSEAADRQVATYSGGMRRRLDLGASLVARPPVLILDEPTTGLDPRTRVELWQFIEDLVADGTTLLLTTQYLEEADRLAARIVVVNDGRVVANGTPGELKHQMGGDVLYVQVTDPEYLEPAAAVLRGLSLARAHTDPTQLQVTVAIPEGASTLVSAARHLDDAGIELADLGIHRPSLDDVFLALTGQPATDRSMPS